MTACIVCNSACPPITRVTRWGAARKYCSSKCIKTAYRQRHPEKDAAAKQKYADNNKVKRVKQTERWRKAHPEYYSQYASLRSRHMQKARPSWLNAFEELWLDELYDLARLTGLQVDHIIPIKNNKVCGLHVPWNLQLLTRSENASKSNKFDEDVIAIISK